MSNCFVKQRFCPFLDKIIAIFQGEISHRNIFFEKHFEAVQNYFSQNAEKLLIYFTLSSDNKYCLLCVQCE